MTTAEAIQLIEEGNGANLGQVIKDLIETHAAEALELKTYWESYAGEVPINDRSFEDKTLANNKLANDYRGEIVDTKLGYFLGIPISYLLDDENTRAMETLKNFNLRNDIEDLDAVTGKYAAVCGKAFRLLYIDKDAEERAMNIPSWECIVIKGSTIEETQYALIYYPVEIVEEGKAKTRLRAEFYSPEKVFFFIQDGSEAFVPDYMVEKSIVPHNFDGVPVIQFNNNDLIQPDFKKVEELIDAMDKTLSDVQNEIEDFRLAYLGFFGTDIDAETVQKLKELRTLIVPDGADAKFIEKDLQGVVMFVENQKDTLDENIHKFAKAVDMSNEKFSGGTQSGDSRKWKMITMENDTVIKERKFIKGLREQYRLLGSAWSKKSVIIDYLLMRFVFTRNLPLDSLYEADVQQKLLGVVSTETRLEQASFITDVEEEMERMEEEALAQIDLEDENNPIIEEE